MICIFQLTQKENQLCLDATTNLRSPSPCAKEESLLIDPGTPTLNNVESLEEVTYNTCCRHNLQPHCRCHKRQCMCHKSRNIVQMQGETNCNKMNSVCVQKQDELKKCMCHYHSKQQKTKNNVQTQQNKTICICDNYDDQNFRNVDQMHDEIRRCKQTLDCKKRGLIEWIKQRTYELVPKKSACVSCELYKLNICDQNPDGCAPKV